MSRHEVATQLRVLRENLAELNDRAARRKLTLQEQAHRAVVARRIEYLGGGGDPADLVLPPDALEHKPKGG